MASQDQEELDDLSLSAPVAVSFLPDQDESALASEKGGITGSPRSVASSLCSDLATPQQGPLCSWATGMDDSGAKLSHTHSPCSGFSVVACGPLNGLFVSLPHLSS